MDQKFRKWYDEIYMPFMKDSSNIRKCDDCPNTDTCDKDICLVELECGLFHDISYNNNIETCDKT